MWMDMNKSRRRRSLCPDELRNLLREVQQTGLVQPSGEAQAQIHPQTHEQGQGEGAVQMKISPKHMKKKGAHRKGRRSITALPNFKAREKYTAQGSMVMVQLQGGCRVAQSDEPRTPVHIEFCPFMEHLTVTEAALAHPFTELTNLDPSTSPKPAPRAPKAYCFPLQDVQQVEAGGEGSMHKLLARHGDAHFLIDQMESFLIDCHTTPRLVDMAEDLETGPAATTNAPSLSYAGAKPAPAHHSQVLDEITHAYMREYTAMVWRTASTRFFAPTEAMACDERAIALHTHVWERFRYPLLSRFLLLEHRPNPHTREGKTAIVGVLGVEKLTLQHTQRNEMDTAVETSLLCKLVKRPNTLEYYHSDTNEVMSPVTWEQRYLEKIGKRSGDVEVSRWDPKLRRHVSFTYQWPLGAALPVTIERTAAPLDEQNTVKQESSSPEQGKEITAVEAVKSSAPEQGKEITAVEAAKSAAQASGEDKVKLELSEQHLDGASDENCLLPMPPSKHNARSAFTSPSLRQRRTLLQIPCTDLSYSTEPETSPTSRTPTSSTLPHLTQGDVLGLKLARTEAERRLQRRLNKALTEFHWEVASSHAAIIARRKPEI